MKKIYVSSLLPLMLLFIFNSCQKMGDGNTSASNEKEVVYNAMNAFDHGDTNALDSLASPDYVEHQIDTVYMKARGLEAVKEIFRSFHKAVPDLKTTIHAIAVAGDTVMVYSTAKGTLVDTLMGMPPTNNMMSFPGVDIFLVKNGKIAEHWGFTDVNAMMMPMQNMPDEKKEMKH